MDDSTDVEVSAARFRALGDPTRLRVIRELAGGTRCVCDLRDHIDVPASLLSHHLRVLRQAGVVTVTRRGRWMDYALAPDVLAQLTDLLAPALSGMAR